MEVVAEERGVLGLVAGGQRLREADDDAADDRAAAASRDRRGSWRGTPAARSDPGSASPQPDPDPSDTPARAATAPAMPHDHANTRRTLIPRASAASWSIAAARMARPIAENLKKTKKASQHGGGDADRPEVLHREDDAARRHRVDAPRVAEVESVVAPDQADRPRWMRKSRPIVIMITPNTGRPTMRRRSSRWTSDADGSRRRPRPAAPPARTGAPRSDGSCR